MVEKIVLHNRRHTNSYELVITKPKGGHTHENGNEKQKRIHRY